MLQKNAHAVPLPNDLKLRAALFKKLPRIASGKSRAELEIP
jgi:hypothetical protein